jgi:hypothetical protein
MANQFATNYSIPANNNSFSVLWKLTRLMKAAGWQYRASSTTAIKDTSGIATNDLWGQNSDPTTDTYGLVIGSFSGTNGTALPQSTISYSNQNGFTINQAGGTVSILTSNGWQTVTYTAGSAASGSSGSLTGCTGGTGLMFNTTASSSPIAQGGEVTFEASTTGWWVAAGPLTVKIPLATAPTGSPVRNEVIAQSASGATGEFLGYVWDSLTSTGWATILPQHTPESTTVAIASDNTTLPQSSINVASTTGFGTSGYIDVWTSQATTTIAVGSNGATLPVATINVVSTAAFPIGGAGSGGFLYVQSSSGTQKIYYTGTSGGNQFTGCTGGVGTLTTNNYVYGFTSLQQITYTGTTGTSFTGCSGGSGVMLLGNNVAGYSATFNNSGSLIGNTSSATFSPTGTVQYFQREIMFSKTTQTNGFLFYVAADGYAENSQLFSTLATSIGCTLSIGPGQGGTNNTFQPLHIAVCGTVGTSGSFFPNTSSAFGNSAQIVAVNATPSTSAAGDGSFYAALSTTNSSPSNQITGILFSRIDDSEPGDLDPYAWFYASTSGFTNFTRTSNVTSTTVPFQQTSVFSTSSPSWLGYQARGCGISSRDVVYGWLTSLAWSPVTTANYTQSHADPGAIRLVAHPAAVTPLAREAPLLYTPGTTLGTFRQLKGRARWVMFFSTGGTYDTFDSKTWLAVMTLVTGTQPCMAFGPYDGTTTPIP